MEEDVSESKEEKQKLVADRTDGKWLKLKNLNLEQKRAPRCPLQTESAAHEHKVVFRLEKRES